MTTTEAPAPAPSVNALAAPLVEALIAEAPALRLGIERLDNGCVLVDAGIDRPGGLEAGLRIAGICMGGLGQAALRLSSPGEPWPWRVDVHTAQPVLACLGSQYAGWGLSAGEGKDKYQALGSGPGRALALKEDLFGELGYHDRAQATCLVMEVDTRPPRALVDKIAGACGVAADRLTLILTPNRSLAGTVQVVARSLEVALHKAHALGFPLERIIDGAGSAPLPPPSPDFITGMGRTNDAILFGGHAHLFVTGGDDEARRLAEALPSTASRDYGKPFAEVFKAYDYDFFEIDAFLFSPARVTVTALDSGHSTHAGRFNHELLVRSFGSEG
ncbi:MAG: methenyltetrahydromethanopterin cyclohydrolase [Gammaproteobacteria bacterium]|nr:methenyltetrahydromethanopterin cyclohydrolase [Gammaproteobacteria bacterium]